MFGPGNSAGIREAEARGWPALSAVPRSRRRRVAAVAQLARLDEVLGEVTDVPARAVLERPAHGDEAEDREVLDVLPQAAPAGVRTDRDSELRRHQQHREDLVDATQATAVDLAEVDRLRLEELLEDDSVLHVLTRRDPDRADGLANGTVAEDVIRAGRFFDPPRVDLSQRTSRADCLVDAPHLVRVEHQTAIGPDRVAQDSRPTQVRLGIGANLQLQVRESARHGLAGEA